MYIPSSCVLTYHDTLYELVCAFRFQSLVWLKKIPEFPEIWQFCIILGNLDCVPSFAPNTVTFFVKNTINPDLFAKNAHISGIVFCSENEIIPCFVRKRNAEFSTVSFRSVFETHRRSRTYSHVKYTRVRFFDELFIFFIWSKTKTKTLSRISIFPFLIAATGAYVTVRMFVFTSDLHTFVIYFLVRHVMGVLIMA